MNHAAEDSQTASWFLVVFTAAISLLGAVWPLAIWASWLRPELAAMTVVYWVINSPFKIGMVYAWSLGLAVDVLEGAVLGQNALGLTVLAYLCFLLHQRLRMLSVVEQAFSVFILVGIYQLIGYWVHGLTGGNYYSMAFLIPALVSALLWPWMKLTLDRLTF